ncbi:MAG: rhodanese-like domain-containing protein [Candidatus Hydrogenedentes bacterium]|nr:rhodanese-like domain-containing protein [Candidatus Hydrogenedentota bacterium]
MKRPECRWTLRRRLRLGVFTACPLVLLSCIGDIADRPANRASDDTKRATLERMVTEYHKEFPDVPELIAGELAMRPAQSRLVLVDVREDTERGVSMIPGAVSVKEFERKKPEHKDKTIVMYCTVGYRSGLKAQQLRKEGFDAYNLRGSIIAWVLDGKPVIDPNGDETKRVHVYGQQWNLVPEGYTPVW